MPLADPQVIQNPDRLAVLRSLELLDTPAEEAFDRLTRLASKIVKAPVSLVSLVDADRQFFKSFVGVIEPWASRRETPLSHAFCQHVVASGEPLIVEDATQHPLVHDNLAIEELKIVSYLGMPLSSSDGYDLGSFCVIDDHPRAWTPAEIEIVRELALSVMVEIELRAEIKNRKRAEAELLKRNADLERVTFLCRTTLDHLDDTVRRGAEQQEVADYLVFARRELDRV